MPGPLAKSRIVMFGQDEPLLRIRSKVLATIGCDTAVLYKVEDVRRELADGPKPALLIICHTAPEASVDQVRKLALKTGLQTYYVERLVPPQQLVEDVGAILRHNTQLSKAASRRPSA